LCRKLGSCLGSKSFDLGQAASLHVEIEEIIGALDEFNREVTAGATVGEMRGRLTKE
jgi:hypothetical protein